ncbi:hypothetical protein SUGI_0605090 [Cryptomeria japonica]|nr:hypothetical protein SUGI_0605090 [Cryptomeria japonica]
MRVCSVLVDKETDKAIALFWSRINAGERVDSVLKNKAIEAIKSLRNCCSAEAPVSGQYTVGLEYSQILLISSIISLDDQIAQAQLDSSGFGIQWKRLVAKHENNVNELNLMQGSRKVILQHFF